MPKLNVKQNSLWFGGITVLLMAAGTDCHKQRDMFSDAFQTASPENQVLWQQASAAAKTNGFVVAMLSLRKLQLETTLTSYQQAAITAKMAAVDGSLSAAERAGDSEAKKAVEEIRQKWRQP